MQLKISRLYRVGQHGLICSMSNYILIIVLDQRTAFGAFIQLLRSRKQNPRRVMHALVGQRAFSLGYDLPGVKAQPVASVATPMSPVGTCQLTSPTSVLPRLMVWSAGRISVSIEGEFSSAANCAAYA